MKNAKALAEYMVGKIIDELDFEPSPSAIDRAVAHVEGILTKSGNLFRVVSDPERLDRIRGKVIDILGRDGMRRNPMRDTIKVGDKVMGSMGVVGGYAGTVTAIKRDGRHTIIHFVDDEGVKYETPEFNITKNVPAKGVFPRKNPEKREDPLDAMYVEYLRPMQDEEPFMMGGTKYEFVRARYPDGRIDIGVYSTAGDLTYGYRHWRRMMGIEKSNPVRPRKGEKTKAFVSRCMSEEKASFPKTKQRIAVCLSKSRKRNPLESGADISDDDDINTKASNMG